MGWKAAQVAAQRAVQRMAVSLKVTQIGDPPASLAVQEYSTAVRHFLSWLKLHSCRYVALISIAES